MRTNAILAALAAAAAGAAWGDSRVDMNANDVKGGGGERIGCGVIQAGEKP